MSTAHKKFPKDEPPMQLHNGDRLTRTEFHRIYTQMPGNFKAELIGGVVHVPSPLKLPHSEMHSLLCWLFTTYKSKTPGVQTGVDATVILSENDEVQPDLFMRILPELKGQSSTKHEYLDGAPELIAEISHSSRSLDLHLKKDRYTQCGVLEYIVVSLQPQQLFWFALPENKQLQPDSKGIISSTVMPGLCIHDKSLFQFDYETLMDSLQQGLSTAEHNQFVERLKLQGLP